MRKTAKVLKLRKLPLVVALASCMYGSVAMAQVAPAQDQGAQAKKEETKKQEPKDLEKITVTGSLLRRLEYDTTSPVQVITADTSVAVGQVDTAEFLQKSSVAAGSTQISQQFSGFVIEGGTGVQTVSLRGLGANRTAVLLNGQRPGPSGTRGQVLAFDLNVIPQSILQRAEIVKDGSSSIYGSDAVAGAVNLITRKNISTPEFTISGRLPFEGGGENFTASAATGWNFDKGNIVLAGEYYINRPLRMGSRSYLKCAQDLIYDSTGKRIDREDRSVTGGTDLGGCNNLYINTVYDYYDPSYRLVPSRDGSTIGGLPGYHPRPKTTRTYLNGGAYYEDQLNLPAWNDVQLVDKQERFSIFASSDFRFGDVNWANEFVFNRRNTDTHRLRQFFPVVEAPTPSGYGVVVLPFSSDQEININYWYLHSTLDGLFKSTDTWAWSVNASHTRSDGDYSVFAIQKSLTGDLTLANSGTASVNYFKPCIMNGDCMNELEDAIGRWHTGNTIYTQSLVNAVATGEMFDLPAGPVGAAFGVEYRTFSINDQPSKLETSGDIWGQSTAQVTKGRDHVKEIFTEIEVPLLKGKPMFEALTFNMSARAFDYASVAKSDYVWKTGLSWQINPSLRLRGTKGTSYRAPALYELYLGNLSGFLGQTVIDPCINWGESTNDFIRKNCAAEGIPDDYAAAGAASATVFTGGGAGFLKPEKSQAFTTGIVFTPSWAPFSVALDYFDITVRDQITQLGAASILGGCYGSPVFPNNFCTQFNRNKGSGNPPFMITDVHATYVNVNKQKVRGYDLLTRFDKDLSFGKLEAEAQFTYTVEDFYLLFDDIASGGAVRSNNVGYIGNPKLVGNTRVGLKNGDFTYTWGMDYVHSTKNLDISDTFTYLGFAGAKRDITAEARLYHNVSVRWDQPKYSILIGIRNLLDKDPPQVSTNVATRYGNVPAFATQYDLYGRSLFARFNYKF